MTCGTAGGTAGQIAEKRVTLIERHVLHNESGLKGARLQPPHMQGGSFSPSVRMENATNPLVQRGPVLSLLFPFARESQVCVRGLKANPHSNQELLPLLSLTRESKHMHSCASFPSGGGHSQSSSEMGRHADILHGSGST